MTAPSIHLKFITKPPKASSRELQIKKYQNAAPSQIFYNPNTTNWFRKKYNEKMVKKSVYSLFPNNCLPVMKEEEWTGPRILREFLTHYLEPADRFRNTWINPKYFFSKEVYANVLKLKEIFLQFDEDGSRKMEIDEMATMFQTNHINVTEDDLVELFFNKKTFRKADINKLYLDFFQFMNFALSKKSDQDFRIFMRKTKEKILREKEAERRKEEEELKASGGKKEPADDLYVDENKEPVFLPMNFNLLLDYFINKGKERKSQKKIRRAIKMMRNILRPGTYSEADPDFHDDDEEEEKEEKDKKQSDEVKMSFEKKNFDRKSSLASSANPNMNSRVNIEEYDRQLKEINTMDIMNEFEKLFKMSYVNKENLLLPKNRKKIYKRSQTLPKHAAQNLNLRKLNLSDKKDSFESKQKSDFEKIDKVERTFRRTVTTKGIDLNQLKNNLINKNKKKDEIKPPTNQSLFFTRLINRHLDTPNIENLHKEFFNKYHSVSLAKKETKKYLLNYLDEMKSRKNNFGFNTTKAKDNLKHKMLPNIYSTATNTPMNLKVGGAIPIYRDSSKYKGDMKKYRSFGFKTVRKENRFLY